MGAVLDDLAFVDHNDRVGISDSTQPVRDYDYCLGDFWVLENLVESLLYLMLGLGVKGAGCLVKEEDLGLPDQCSSNRNPLLLSSRQLDSSLSNKSIIGIWEDLLVADEVVDIGLLASKLNLLLSRLRGQPITDILGDRSRKEDGLLLDDGNTPFITLRIERLKILCTIADASTEWIIKSFDQLNYG